MYTNFKRLHNEEQGQAALETAIILIAFVVVAAVFAFTILSAGNASTEKGKKAISAGLEGVQSSMELKGSVLAVSGAKSCDNSKGSPTSTAASEQVDCVIFTVSLVAGGTPVDLSATGGSGSNALVIGYRDTKQVLNDVPWTVKFVGQNNADSMLDAGELAEISVDLTGDVPALPKNTPFTIELKPPMGAVVAINRTTPAALTAVMELN